jgi:hypothetical protein
MFWQALLKIYLAAFPKCGKSEQELTSAEGRKWALPSPEETSEERHFLAPKKCPEAFPRF